MKIVPLNQFFAHPNPEIAALAVDMLLGEVESDESTEVNIGSNKTFFVAVARGGRARAARQRIRVLANLPAPVELGSLHDADAPLMVRYDAAQALSSLGATAGKGRDRLINPIGLD